MIIAVLGTQWGDEGKGKIVDLLGRYADIVCRCQGGNNAGHTVIVENDDDEKTKTKYELHMLPSGIVRPGRIAVIGNGCVVHIDQLLDELDILEKAGFHDCRERLIVSDRAHIVFDIHQLVDGVEDRSNKIGTTKRGIGPAYSCKASRTGLRMCDLLSCDFDSVFAEKYKKLLNCYKNQYQDSLLDVDLDVDLEKWRTLAHRMRPLVRDTVRYLNHAIETGKSVMVEGAQSTALDIDFGSYPYVTSSNCTVGGVCTGLGVPARSVGDVYGVAKAYLTRVGAGAFPTELTGDLAEQLVNRGKEYGVTTGRKRRVGWMDTVMLRHSHMINGFTALALTKLDVLDTFEEIKIGVSYRINGEKIDYFPSTDAELRKVEVEYITLPGWKTSTEDVRHFNKLPKNAREFVFEIEWHCGRLPVRWIGVGPSRESIIERGIF